MHLETPPVTPQERPSLVRTDLALLASLLAALSLCAPRAHAAIDDDEDDDDEEEIDDAIEVAQPTPPDRSTLLLGGAVDRYIATPVPGLGVGYLLALSPRVSVLGFAGASAAGTVDRRKVGREQDESVPDHSFSGHSLRARLGAQYYVLPGLSAPFLGAGAFGVRYVFDQPVDDGYGRLHITGRGAGVYVAGGYTLALDRGARVSLGASYGYATYRHRVATVTNESDNAEAKAERATRDPPSHSFPSLDVVFGLPL
jgi:hypothetical protein